MVVDTLTYTESHAAGYNDLPTDSLHTGYQKDDGGPFVERLRPKVKTLPTELPRRVGNQRKYTTRLLCFQPSTQGHKVPIY